MFASSDPAPGTAIVARVIETDCTRALLSLTTLTTC
jgi:hypothetical protein